MGEERFESNKFEEVAFPRYVKVKESIESLMQILDFEQVKQDGIDRVLHAILQLIDENDDKLIEEKRETIEDAIYNGNIFRHYFSEENQAKAVEILSKTSLLNDEERLIYIINFYMPNDINFSSVYSKFDKNIDKIAEYYGLTSLNSGSLVYARVVEISKFHKLYQGQKERQRIRTLAAVHDATEEPSIENIDNAKSLIGDLTDTSLRETLEQQLVGLEQVDSTPKMVESDFNLDGVSEFEETFEPIENSNNSFGEFTHSEPAINIEEPVDTAEEESLEVVEPALLEDVFEAHQEESVISDDNIGKSVMESLQTLVESAKSDAQKVEQLSLELGKKDAQIAELQETVSTKTQELQTKEAELQERDNRLEEQAAQLHLLRSEVESRDVALIEANRIIASKDEEITSLNVALSSYKNSLSEIQKFLSSAQHVGEIEENPRKVA